MQVDSTQAARSPLEEAVARVGDRWSLLVIEALMSGPRRFGELQEQLAGIAPNVLSDRLKRLERSAIVLGRPYQDRPRRLEYELSASGQELVGALRLLADWGAGRTTDAEAPRHEMCGTPLEVRWYCPTCDVPVPDDDADELEFA